MRTNQTEFGVFTELLLEQQFYTSFFSNQITLQEMYTKKLNTTLHNSLQLNRSSEYTRFIQQFRSSSTSDYLNVLNEHMMKYSIVQIWMNNVQPLSRNIRNLRKINLRIFDYSFEWKAIDYIFTCRDDFNQSLIALRTYYHSSP